jgi:hypothetical protein
MPLGEMIGSLRWVSRLAGALQRGELVWDSPVRPWADAVVDLRRVLRLAPQPFRVLDVARMMVAHGTSDAAVSERGGFRGLIVRWRDGLVVARRGARTRRHINVEEFLAGADGLGLAFARAKEKAWCGTYWWKVDNTVAQSWMRRSWLPEWELNTVVCGLHG